MLISQMRIRVNHLYSADTRRGMVRGAYARNKARMAGQPSPVWAPAPLRTPNLWDETGPWLHTLIVDDDATTRHAHARLLHMQLPRARVHECATAVGGIAFAREASENGDPVR